MTVKTQRDGILNLQTYKLNLGLKSLNLHLVTRDPVFSFWGELRMNLWHISIL